MTTGTWESSGSDLIRSRICRPSYLGRLRSRRMRSARGAGIILDEQDFDLFQVAHAVSLRGA